jgi:hypothetical protein
VVAALPRASLMPFKAQERGDRITTNTSAAERVRIVERLTTARACIICGFIVYFVVGLLLAPLMGRHAKGALALVFILFVVAITYILASSV